MQLIIVLLFFAICLGLIGVGIVIAGCVIAAIAALASFGVVSSSVLVGITRKDPSSAVRVFILEASTLLGGGAGSGAATLLFLFTDVKLTLTQSLMLGFFAGSVLGIGIGFLVNLAWYRLLKGYRRNQPTLDLTVDRVRPGNPGIQ
jgi:hypothetical protein